MIKSTLNNWVEEEDITYPILARNQAGSIVLFSELKKGTVVNGPQLGTYRDHWVPVTNHKIWTILNKTQTVILSND